MNGKNHKNANIILAFLFSLLYLYYTKNIALEPLLKFWLGAGLGIVFFSPDLDTTSNPTKAWGPLKIIWKPFRNAGHREILHNPIWGPFILVCFLGVPLHYAGFELWEETIVGMVVMIESHIFTDKIF